MIDGRNVIISSSIASMPRDPVNVILQQPTRDRAKAGGSSRARSMLKRRARSKPVEFPISTYSKLEEMVAAVKLPLQLGFDTGDRLGDQLGNLLSRC